MASFLSDPQSFALTVTLILTVCGVAFFAGRSIALPFGGR
jgi:hypothetical protein